MAVGCIAVGIVYCADNRHFKVFDSHARDIYGKSHPEGTCMLLDISFADNLVYYFQSFYGANNLYELKCLHITKYDMTASNSVKDVLNTPSDQQNFLKNYHCFAIALYCICYSIISPFGYWNSSTLDAIIQNGTLLNITMQSEHHLASIYIHTSVSIFGIKINVDVDKLSHRKLTKLPESRISLKTTILRNNGKTEFLTWISSYCAACIYQQNFTIRLFSLLTYEGGNSPAMDT